MKRRILSVVLTLALCLSLVPVPAVAAEPEEAEPAAAETAEAEAAPAAETPASEAAAVTAAGVTYSPKRLEAVVLPTAAARDSNFVRNRVRIKDSPFNIDSCFNFVSGTSLVVDHTGSPDKNTLAPNLSFMHSENNSWEASYRWKFTANYETQKTSVFNELIRQGQITIWAQAKLTPDKHSHFGTHGSIVDRALLKVMDHRNGIEVFRLQNTDKDGDGVGKLYEGSGTPKDTHYLGFRINMSGSDCSCGSSKVSNVYIHLSDNSGPKIAGIYPSDANGAQTQKEYYKAGETVYFTVAFSENIRFADDKPHDIALKLDLIDNATGSTSTVQPSISAGLTKLVDDKLIFAYTVPSTPLDVRVGAVSPGKQSWVTAETPLAILDGNGNVLDNTTFKAKSAITDLAGNPMEWLASVTMSPKTVLDTVTAKVVQVNASASMTGDWKATTDGGWPADIPASAIWAGPLDTVSFTVTLDDEVGYLRGYKYYRFGGIPWINATLNLSQGGTVTAMASSVEYRKDSVNDGRISTVIHFRPVLIWDGTAYTDGDYIRITGLQFSGGFYDPAGNRVTPDFSGVSPQEKFKLDVTDPVITLKDPLPAADAPGTEVFYRTVPFTVTDDGSGVDVNGVTAQASVKGGSSSTTNVTWCVTASPDRPADDNQYGTAENFDYVTANANDPMYLHIRVSDTGTSHRTIRIGYAISARDCAGNWDEKETGYSEAIVIGTDTTPPTARSKGESIDKRKYTLSARVQVSDERYLFAVRYYWKVNIGGAEEQTSTVNVINGYISGAHSETFAASTKDLIDLAGKKGSATLYVYAEDDSKGNAGGNGAETAVATINFDFSAQKTKYTVDDPLIPTQKPTLTVEPPEDTENLNMVTAVIMGIAGSNVYNVYVVGENGDASALNLFDAASSDASNALFWGSCGRPESYNGNQGTPYYSLPHYKANSIGGGELWNPATQSNGDMEVFLVTLPRENITEGDTTSDGWVMSLKLDGSATVEEPFTIACGMGRSYAIGADTPKNSAGNNVNGVYYVGTDTVPSRPVQTLTGLTVPVIVRPNQQASFNYQDLDFSKAKAWLKDLDGKVIADSEQALTPPDVGADSYTFNYLISSQLSGTRGFYTLCVEIPYIDAMAEGGKASETAELFLYMDDEVFDDYYPVQYRQYYGVSKGDDIPGLNLGDRTEELFTNEDGAAGFASQVVMGMAEEPSAGYDYKAVRTLTFSATRYGVLLPLQVWTGETEPANDAFIPNSDQTVKDGNYVLTPVLGTQDDADCDGTLTLRAGENRVYYRVQLPNGTMTPTRVLNVRVETAAPRFTVDFAHPKDTDFVTVTVKPDDDYTVQQMDVTGSALLVQGNTDDVVTVPLDTARQAQVKIGADNAYLMKSSNYFLVDSYGNLGVAASEDYNNAYNVAQRFDLLAPTVTLSELRLENQSNDDGAYSLTLDLADPKKPDWQYAEETLSSGLDLSTLRISVEYQDTAGENGVSSFAVPVPASYDPDNSELEGNWNTQITDGSAPFGLTSVNVNKSYNSDGIQFILLGVLPLDARAAGNKVFTVTVADKAGNVGAPCVGTLKVDTAIPEEITFTQSPYSPRTIDSSSNVRIISPIEEEMMRTDHFNLPFYKTGDYPIRFIDPFGTAHTQTVHYEAPDYYSVTLSPAEDTTGPVTVTITSNYNGSEGTGNFLYYALGSTVTLESIYDTVKVEDAISLPAETKAFDVTVEANDTLYIWQDRGGFLSEYSTTDDIVQITNIVTKPATPPAQSVQVAWYDGDGQRLDPSAAGPVKGPVTALVECADELTGDTRCMFPCGTAAGTSYTFTFADSFGSEGTLAAALPWDVAPAEQEGGVPADTTAPAYQVRLYQKNNDIWRQLGAFDSQLLGVLADGRESPQSPNNLSRTMADGRALNWQTAFSVEDESQAKLVVKLSQGPVTFDSENDAGLPAELTVGPASLTWTGEEPSPALYLYFVDSAGNATEALEVRFPAVYVPGQPTAAVEYEYKGNNTIWAYLVPGENMESYTVQDPENKLKRDEAEGPHQGQYYCEFTENGSYTFRFINSDERTGTVTATVNTIDTREMTIIAISFLAGGRKYDAAVDENGEVTWDQSGVSTNANVVAEVFTNLPIREAGFTGDPDGLTVSYAANKATVIFHDNVGGALLSLTGRNNSGTALILPAVTCIDRTAPVVRKDGAEIAGPVAVSGNGERRVEVTFTTDEPTYLDSGAEEAATHRYAVSKDGAYSLTFADKAGNVTQVTLNVTGLEGRLAMEFSKDANGANATSSPSEAWKNDPLKGGQSFYVRFTRNVTASLAGEAEKSCAKGTWCAFPIPADGGLLTLRATDSDGKTAYAYLRADSADTMPPTILFESNTVYGRVDMAQEEREALLKAGVTVKDDSGEGLEYTMDLSEVTWTAEGRYTVTYTAADASGNQAAASRTLVLLPAGLPTILINGEQVAPFGTRVLSQRDIKVAVEEFEGKLFVSVKPGRLTQAQMKLGAETLLANGTYTGPLSCTLKRSGFHTLYIRTQERGGILIYLYVTD